jgi:hypothetical protein
VAKKSDGYVFEFALEIYQGGDRIETLESDLQVPEDLASKFMSGLMSTFDRYLEDTLAAAGESV